MTAASFDLFPNPARESFTLDIKQGREKVREVQIIDTHGKVVGAKTLDKKDRQATFFTKRLVSGMYFVKVLEEGKDVFSGKIIVQ